MFQSFITKSDLVSRIHKTVKLFFFRKNIKGSKSEQIENIEMYIDNYLKVYGFKCDLIHIDIRKKGIRIKLKNLRRFKHQKFDFLSEPLISLIGK